MLHSCCLPSCHRSVFFRGQIERPSTSLLSGILGNSDLPVRVGINREHVHVIDDNKNVRTLFFPYLHSQPFPLFIMLRLMWNDLMYMMWFIFILGSKLILFSRCVILLIIWNEVKAITLKPHLFKSATPILLINHMQSEMALNCCVKCVGIKLKTSFSETRHMLFLEICSIFMSHFRK